MTEQSESRADWGRRALVAACLVGFIIVAGFLASVTVPRWWAHRIGDQVDGSITQGVLVGLFYGFVFTLLPLLVIVAVLRWRRTWKAIAFAVIVALALALPNLMTLGIVVGRGDASHAGDRTLDVDAPAFRGASLAGVLLALLFTALVVHLLMSRAASRQELDEEKNPRPSGPAAPSGSN
jgi:energy-coupling factor transporter transmembrane protein EcfT